MSLSVLNVCDKALGLAELLTDELYDVNVLHLVVTANIVNLADLAVVDNEVDSAAVILNVEPVTNIQSLAVNRKWLVRKRVCNHKRNEFLREVIRSIVVRTT